MEKNIKIYILSGAYHPVPDIVYVLTWSLLGFKNKLGPSPDRSPLGVSFKISDEHPHPFHMRSPSPGELLENFRSYCNCRRFGVRQDQS